MKTPAEIALECWREFSGGAPTASTLDLRRNFIEIVSERIREAQSLHITYSSELDEVRDFRAWSDPE